MKRVTGVVVGLMLFPVFSAAQSPAAGQKVSLATSLQRTYATMKDNLAKAAEKMPEGDYAFKPGPQPDVRTYGQLLGHQADHQFVTCATLKGVPNPNPAEATEKKAMKGTKAELVKALAGAFAFCDSAIAALTDQTALQMIKSPDGETARGGVVSTLLSHGHGSENLAALYLRLKGIARPW